MPIAVEVGPAIPATELPAIFPRWVWASSQQARFDKMHPTDDNTIVAKKNIFMASFDIVSRVDPQEVDNAVNITRKVILTRYDFRESKTELTLDKKEKKIRVVTEDEMKMRAVQESLLENLVRRKIDPQCLDAKEIQPAARGMIQREIALKEGVDAEKARTVVKIIKGLNLKVQAAIQDQQVRVSAKQIDDLQTVMKAVRAADIGIPLQFVNMIR